MKILFLNSNDLYGGAAKACCRLLLELRKQRCAVKFIVQNKYQDLDDEYEINDNLLLKVYDKVRIFFDFKILSLFKSKSVTWSISFLPCINLKKIYNDSCDIIHLHWIGNGFIPAKKLAKMKKPIVWTIHDSWAFTGGCHIPYECTNYEKNCGHCKYLKHPRKRDLSYYLLKKKKKYWSTLDINIVAPSTWLANCAKNSSIFKNKKVFVIPNGINTKVFKPLDKMNCRNIWDIPQAKKIILFGAYGSTSDSNKGFHYLVDALKKIDNTNEYELIVFGANKSNYELSINTKYVGVINDEISLATLYSAADVIAIPSKSESFCQVAAEAMSCGIPVVAFNTTGVKDIVDHRNTGYLANPFDTQDFAYGIRWIFENYYELSKNSREKVIKNYDIEVVGNHYTELYKNILTEG